nr:PREDICTED: transcription factor Adf-1-like [Linepithema humile]
MNVDKLISEIYVRSPLWDRRNSNHHNRFVLDKLWDEVAHQLHTTRITARSKWKALRDQFRTILASLPKSKLNDLTMNSYEGQWKYFRRLLFLKDQFRLRISKENFTIMDEDKVLNDTSQNLQEDSKYVDENEDQLSMPSAGETVSSKQCTESVTLSSRSSNSAGSHQNINTKRKHSTSEDVGSALLEVEKKKVQYLEEKGSQKANEDDDLNFFRSLLPHINTLSSYDKMSYRIKILKVTQDFLTSSDRTERAVQIQLQNPAQ